MHTPRGERSVDQLYVPFGKECSFTRAEALAVKIEGRATERFKLLIRAIEPPVLLCDESIGVHLRQDLRPQAQRQAEPVRWSACLGLIVDFKAFSNPTKFSLLISIDYELRRCAGVNANANGVVALKLNNLFIRLCKLRHLGRTHTANSSEDRGMRTALDSSSAQ